MPLNVITDDTSPAPPSAPGRRVAPPSDAPPGSALARLRARAAVQRQARTLDVAIPEWDGALVCRYQMPPMEDADRLIASAAAFQTAGASASMSRIAVDLMSTCAQTLLGVGEDGTIEDLHHTYTGGLLELLNLPLPPGVDDPGDVSVFEVITTVFFGNWMAINVHAGTVMTWLQGDESGLGEPAAGS